VINNISGIHQEFFNLEGLGILIGDGQLPNPDLEKIIEACIQLLPDFLD